MEGKQNVKTIKTIIIKNVFSFENLMLLSLVNKEPKIRVLNIMRIDELIEKLLKEVNENNIFYLI